MDIVKKTFNFIYLKIDYVILSLISLIIVLQSPLRPFGSGISGVDSSVFRYIGREMARGQLPYRDIFDHKGPLLYLINYIGENTLKGYGTWLIELLFMFVTIVSLYKVARLFTDRFVALFPVIIALLPMSLYFEQGNLVEEYALPFISISLYIFLKSIINKESLSRRNIFILGAMFSCVALLRPNMVVVWVVFCGFLFIKAIIIKNWRMIKDYVIYFTLGSLSMALITLSPFIITRTMFNFYDTYLIFNLEYSKLMPGNKLASIMFFSSNTIFIFSIAILLGGVLIKLTKRNYNRIELYLLSLLFLITSLISVTLSGMNYGHYGIILIPCYLIPAALAISSIYGYFEYCVSKRIAIFIATLLLIMSSYQIFETFHKNIKSAAIKDSSLDSVVEVLKEFSKEDGKILVDGNNVILYLLLDKVSASKYIYQYPIKLIRPSISEEYEKDKRVAPIFISNTANATLIDNDVEMDIINGYYIYYRKASE